MDYAFAGLDKVDRKLLFELDKNSRQPRARLARKLRISREVADYRIKRLLDRKIIRTFFTHIHAEKAGYANYELYFKIKGMSKDQEDELIKHLSNEEKVYRVISCDGAYDLIVHLAETDIYSLEKIVQGFLQKYDSFFVSKEVALITRLYHCNKKFLSSSSELQRPSMYGGEMGRIKLDGKDEEILKWLSNNANMDSTEIAKMIGTTANAVIYRIRQLEKNRIIGGYSCAINPSVLQLAYSKIMLRLHFGNEKRERELYQFCVMNKYVTRFLYCIGRWDFEIEAMVESLDSFHGLLREIKEKFSDIIKDYEYVTISKSHKLVHFPGAYPQKKP